MIVDRIDVGLLLAAIEEGALSYDDDDARATLRRAPVARRRPVDPLEFVLLAVYLAERELDPASLAAGA